MTEDENTGDQRTGRHHRGVVFIVLIASIFVAFTAGSGWLFNDAREYGRGRECVARWKDSGYAVDYSHLGGCRIRLSDGRWLPEAAAVLTIVRDTP